MGSVCKLFASLSLFHQLDSNINYMTPLWSIHDPGPRHGCRPLRAGAGGAC